MDFECPNGNLVVIPARLESTRLAQKALLEESGEPLVLHVVRQAIQSRKADRVVVATDSQKIKEIVISAGFEAVMTDPNHTCGTDRVAEVAALSDAHRVVNVQGDEPFIPPELIDVLFDLMHRRPEIPMGTAVHRHQDQSDLVDPNCVKVVIGAQNQALYFSRSLIPYNFTDGTIDYFRHIGIYAFQRDYLLRFVKLPLGRLEQIERLEQLRALENGDTIEVVETTYDGFSIETQENYDQFLKRLN